MSNIRISQLPTAQTITGSELVPVVQNGVTVQTTVSAITQSPSLTETFLTVGQQPLLPNSRYLSAINGIGITDGGAQGSYTIALNGTSGSLESAGTGVIVKSAANTIVSRSLATSGNGISVTNGSGVSGDPTFRLTGLAQALANATGTGLLALNGSSTISPVTITGTSNQIGVTGGDGSSTPTISLANNPVIPGTAGVTLPVGTTAQRGSTTGEIRYNSDTSRYEGYYAGSWQNFGLGDGAITSVSGTTNQINVSNVGGISTVSIASDPVIPGTGAIQIPSGSTASRPASPVNGDLRYNTTTATFEGYANGVWGAIVSGSGVTSVATGTGLTGGPITSTGTISIANTGVTAATYGTSSVVPVLVVNAQGQITSATNTTIDAVTLTTGTISTTPSGSTDIANKSYVDSVAQGLDAKASCVAASTTNIASLSGLLTVDGYTLNTGDRVLVKNQASSQNNGIYVAAAGAWSRSSDMSTWAQVPNAFTFIEQGTTQADTGWVCTANQGGTIGVTAMPWTQFSGAGTYTAGTGLTLTGSVFSITNTTVTAAAYGSASSVGTFTVNAQGQLTAAASTPIAIAASQITSGILGVANGGTGLSSVTANQIPYGNGTSALSTSANLTFNGTTLTNTGNAIISDNSANAALRVTQIGSGNALLVEDSANPDSSPFVIDQNGKVAIGSTTAAENLNLVADGRNIFELTRGSADAIQSVISYKKARGSSASPTIVSNGDGIGDVAFSGYDGASYIQAALIQGQVDGTPGTGSMPGRLVLSTTPSGSSTPVERMRIGNAGNVAIGSTGNSFQTFSVARNITGGAFSTSILAAGTVQSDVTSRAAYFQSSPATAAASFTLASLPHFYANQGAIGAGSTVTNQYGFLTENTLTGATNNYGFFGNIASGTGRYNFYANGTAINVFVGQTSLGGALGSESLRVTPVASAVNYINVQGNSTSGPPSLTAQGSDTNINMYYGSKGTGSHLFVNGSGAQQFVVSNTTSAVNYLQATGNIASNGPVLSAQGSDTNIPILMFTKGSGFFYVIGNNANQFAVGATASAVNYLQATGSATGNAVALSAQGSDTNVGLQLLTKGTGSVFPRSSSTTPFYVENPSFGAAFAVTQPGGATVNANYVQVSATATGGTPAITAVGSDTNINLALTPKGTGVALTTGTTAFGVPVGTTAQRPTGATGYIRYNSDTPGFEGYNGSTWASIGGGSNITNLGLWENASVISANYTIGTGNNAMSAGPITINSGVTVTIPSGSTWVIN